MICIMHCMSDTLSIQTSVLTGMLVLKSCFQADHINFVYMNRPLVCVCASTSKIVIVFHILVDVAWYTWMICLGCDINATSH